MIHKCTRDSIREEISINIEEKNSKIMLITAKKCGSCADIISTNEFMDFCYDNNLDPLEILNNLFEAGVYPMRYEEYEYGDTDYDEYEDDDMDSNEDDSPDACFILYSTKEELMDGLDCCRDIGL